MNSSVIIQSIAESRARGSSSLVLAWKQALECLPRMKNHQMEAIGRAAPSPAAVRHFAKYLSRDKGKSVVLERFFRETRDSGESLEDWMEAFNVLAEALSRTSHRPTLGMAIGYLHCCMAVVNSGERYETFPMTVETMLETYGYAGESDQCGD